MNISNLVKTNKPISMGLLFKGLEGISSVLHIRQGKSLNEHESPVPVLLLCVKGCVDYYSENQQKEQLQPGDYIAIKPKLKHWLTATEDSLLLLLK